MAAEPVTLADGHHEIALHSIELVKPFQGLYLTSVEGAILRSTTMLKGTDIQIVMRTDDRVGGMLLEGMCWATGSSALREFSDRVDQILFDIRYGASWKEQGQPLRTLRDERLSVVLDIERKFDVNVHAKRHADYALCRRMRILKSYE